MIEGMGDRNKADGQSLLKALEKVLPEGVFEGKKLSLARLKELLGENIIEEPDNRFNFNWVNKDKVLNAITLPVIGILIPDKQKSVDYDKTANYVLVGENLEILKLLLKQYFEKIKVIYIDPPYNTGKDFTFKDNFREPVRAYLLKTGQLENKNNYFADSPETTGRYHSNWLNFMYPRLFLAKSLLKDDGAIFISIDDNEVHHLRMIMDEIFGEENFVAQIVWHSKYTVSNDTKYISSQHEYILFYAKEKGKLHLNLLPRTERMNKSYRNPDRDPRGPWKATPLHAKSGKGQSYRYIFKNGVAWEAPKGRYPRYSIEKLKELEEDNRISFGSDGRGTPSVKTFLSEVQQGRISGTVWRYEEVGHTHKANEDLAKILGKGAFDNPKTIELIKKMLLLTTSKGDDLIMDFFAGSGTTGHAVWELNKDDEGKRRFILINLDEEVMKAPIKDQYLTVADICITRLRRVSKTLRTEMRSKLIRIEQDFGFKVMRLNTRNNSCE